jgi:hypothetical protein
VPGRSGTLRPADGTLLVGALALVAALVAVAAGAEPTGDRLVDAALTCVGVVLFVVVGARAPWWAVAAAAGVALAIALDPVLIVVALVGLVVALWAGTRPAPPTWSLAASLGVTSNVLIRAELVGGRYGTSAAVSLGAVAVVFLLGTFGLSKRQRWLTWGAVVVVGIAAAACTAGFAYAGLQSRHDLAAGLTTAELGVAALESGDFEQATRWFDEAAGYLEAANTRLDEPWVGLAAAVPVVAQHQAAVRDMARAGADGARTVATALDRIDPDELRPRAGKFDLVALAELEEPLTDVRDALVRLRRTTDESRSGWLVNRATYELDDFDSSVDEHLPSLENALAALRMAPRLLGADGPRTYLLLFTTPSESRGLGGFVGSYAELHVQDGHLALDSFDRSQTLDARAFAAGAVIDGHDEFVRQYGRFMIDGATVGDTAFRNLAMTPDFPTVGAIASDLYAQTTGTEVDGVIAMDPFVVAALLRYTGPVHLESLNREIGPDDALPYLLRDQYVAGVDDTARADGLAEAASQAFEGLLAGALPEPIQLARDLGPLASQRRLLVWSADAEEQALLERVHISGEIPPLDGADGWSFTITNVGGNKIDSYLERRARYTARTDPDTGVTSGTLRIELTNTAPVEGLPRYVIGNRIGKPEGTSTMWLTVYSPLGLDELTLDGDPVGVEVGEEAGWRAYRVLLDVAAGETVSVQASLSGTVARPDEIVTWSQPMANDLQPL